MDNYKMLGFVIVHLSIFCVIITSYFVEGRSSMSLQDLELNRELSMLNKHGVKTIETTYGNIYDCVDIYKQLSLDHPLLKNHKIQMKPSKQFSARDFGLDDECPKGTVPIQRTTKDELIRAKSSFREFDERMANGIDFAGISTAKPNKYHGAQGKIGVYNPAAKTRQFSASVISVEGGPIDQFSTIRVGWMVNPSLFNDNLTRMYTLWGQGKDGQMHGCYDTRCPGFVYTNPQVPLNLALPTGPEAYSFFGILQDKNTMNWWMYAAEGVTVGYWPADLFTHLKDGAEVLQWGGMVYSVSPESPPMGSGGRDCYFSQLLLVDENWNKRGNNINISVPLDSHKSRCYKVGDKSFKDPVIGYSFWFGGKGGTIFECQ